MDNASALLSQIVTFRSYAKYMPHLVRREIWEETVNRTMTSHLDKFPKLSKKIINAFEYVHSKEVLCSMRFMQFGGTAVSKNHIRGYNCSFANINDVKVFSEILYVLLSGCGVGYSVQKHHVSQLPVIRQPREEGYYVVHDSIEGWSQALDILLEAYFYKKVRPQFDFSMIRAKGSLLVTTGAKAPGPEPLKTMLKLVEDRLKGSIDKKLRPIDVHDIICIVSDCVLAGGIRRAALISLFDRDDQDMLKCKTGNWWEKHPYRARANNSVVQPRMDVTKEEFYALFDVCRKSGSGEPGFSWTNNQNTGFNPCQPAWATVLTPNGISTIGQIKIGDSIWGGSSWVTVTNKWSTGIKPVMAYRTTAGTFYGTENHRVVSNGIKVEAKDAETIDVSFVPGQLFTGTSNNTTPTMINGVLIYTLPPNNTALILSRLQVSTEEVFDITVDHPDHTYWTDGLLVSNCHEVSLNHGQFCNLTSVNQRGITTKQELLNRVKAAAFIGTLQASYTDFPFLRPEWRETTEREALIGVSFTGIADAFNVVTTEWLEEGAKMVLDTNIATAKQIGINPAARTTTLKPEGSGSCVVGSGSGIHARQAEFYLRRVRMVSDDALSMYLKSVVPDLCEDAKSEANTMIITLPQRSPAGAILRNNETALDLFNRAMVYNKHWVRPGHVSGDNNNNVSCTISVKENEWDGLCKAMWDNRGNYSGISLLPYDSGTYIQAPFEDCDEATYNKYMGLVKEVDLRMVKEDTDGTNLTETAACAGGACEIVRA